MPTDMKTLVAEARKQIEEISVEEAEKRIADGSVVLDVREPDEYEAGRPRAAINIPRGVLEYTAPEHPATMDKDAPICIFCRSGGRAALAAVRLQEMGYTNVVSVKGGFKAWSDAGLPAESTGTDEEE